MAWVSKKGVVKVVGLVSFHLLAETKELNPQQSASQSGTLPTELE